MLKIRYNAKTGLLSGWTDIEEEFVNLNARKGEELAILDIPMPDNDDYENYKYDVFGELIPSGKQTPIPVVRRNLAKEIDAIKADIIKLKEK